MTHPHDVALLNDLVDDRLSPAAVEDLRRRLADEPALAAAYDELQRMRAALAALPAPASVPADFLARVRARAGLPPSVAAAAPAARAPATPLAREAAAREAAAREPAARDAIGSGAAVAPPGAAGDETTCRDARGRDVGPAATPGRGRVVPWSRFAVPIAAGLGLVLGGGLFLASRVDRGNAVHLEARGKKDGTWSDARPAEHQAEPVAGAKQAVADANAFAAPETPPAGTPGAPAAKPGAVPSGGGLVPGGAGGGDGEVPRYRAPGGAVPEGLRRPSDVPAPPQLAPPQLAPPELAPPPAPGAPITAGPPPHSSDPAAPVAPAVPLPERAPEPAEAGTTGAPEPAAAADEEGAPEDARARLGAARRAADLADDEPRAPEATAGGLRAGLMRAEEGVDEVVVVRAASVDEVRAQLALLALPPAAGGPAATGLELVPTAEPRAAAGTPATDQLARGPAEGALGSFVAELSPAAWAALEAARTATAVELADHDGAGAPTPARRPGTFGARPTAAPDAPSTPAPSTPAPSTPAMPTPATPTSRDGAPAGDEPAGAGPGKAAGDGKAKAPPSGRGGPAPTVAPPPRRGTAPDAPRDGAPASDPTPEGQDAAGPAAGAAAGDAAKRPGPAGAEAATAPRRVRIVVLPR